MSDFNSEYNRAVWFDIPVADLERAAAFYRAVLNVGVSLENAPGGAFGLLDHAQGNGGCLMVAPESITGTGGIMVYLNVAGRLRDAVAQVTAHGGQVVQAPHSLGGYGSRAVILDSEGNRLALHSTESV